MSDFPFKPPVANPFSASTKDKNKTSDPLNRVEQVIAAQPQAEPKQVEVVYNQPQQPSLPPIEKPKEPLPLLTMEEKSCRSCEYYAFDEKMERCDAYKGECRRHAPNPATGARACWPEVPWNSWCGEWENGVSNEDMVRMARDIGESLSHEEF